MNISVKQRKMLSETRPGPDQFIPRNIDYFVEKCSRVSYQ